MANPIFLCFVADLKHLQGKRVPAGAEGQRPPDTCRPLCAGSGTASTRDAPLRAGLGGGCGRGKMQRHRRWEARLGRERAGAHGFARAVHSVEPRALLLL